MSIPRVLIVAGSDAGGGAGIQADVKTVTMLGGHAATAITALTAQNTLGVHGVHPVPADFVVAQMESVLGDIGADAVKIGMIGSAATAHAIADVLERLCSREGGSPGWVPAFAGTHKLPVVFDPVMIATSGAVLADDETIAAFTRLMRVATVVTPNLPELEALGGVEAVLAHGCHLVVKGGHADGATVIDRLLAPEGREIARCEGERIDTTSTHGTGCTFASALATRLAGGAPIDEAFRDAVRFVRIALLSAPGLGEGHGPIGHALGVDPFKELEG